MNNKIEKINWVADKILEEMGNEKEFIDLATKQKLFVIEFKKIYELARKQLIKELKADKKKLKDKYNFYKEQKNN